MNKGIKILNSREYGDKDGYVLLSKNFQLRRGVKIIDFIIPDIEFLEILDTTCKESNNNLQKLNQRINFNNNYIDIEVEAEGTSVSNENYFEINIRIRGAYIYQLSKEEKHSLEEILIRILQDIKQESMCIVSNLDRQVEKRMGIGSSFYEDSGYKTKCVFSYSIQKEQIIESYNTDIKKHLSLSRRVNHIDIGHRTSSITDKKISLFSVYTSLKNPFSKKLKNDFMEHLKVAVSIINFSSERSEIIIDNLTFRFFAFIECINLEDAKEVDLYISYYMEIPYNFIENKEDITVRLKKEIESYLNKNLDTLSFTIEKSLIPIRFRDLSSKSLGFNVEIYSELFKGDALERLVIKNYLSVKDIFLNICLKIKNKSKQVMSSAVYLTGAVKIISEVRDSIVLIYEYFSNII